MFNSKKRRNKLDLLIIRLSKQYSKSEAEVIEVLIDFIERNELEYFNSKTFVNKKLIEEFRVSLEKTKKLSQKNLELEEQVQQKKDQIIFEVNIGQKLRLELEELSQKLKQLRIENSELKNEKGAVSKNVKIVKYKNHNKKIEYLQEKNVDYKKHQIFLMIVTVIGILIAVTLFFLKTKIN